MRGNGARKNNAREASDLLMSALRFRGPRRYFRERPVEPPPPQKGIVVPGAPSGGSKFMRCPVWAAHFQDPPKCAVFIEDFHSFCENVGSMDVNVESMDANVELIGVGECAPPPPPHFRPTKKKCQPTPLLRPWTPHLRPKITFSYPRVYVPLAIRSTFHRFHTHLFLFTGGTGLFPSAPRSASRRPTSSAAFSADSGASLPAPITAIKIGRCATSSFQWLRAALPGGS